MGLESLELEDGQKTPPQKPRSTPRVLLRMYHWIVEVEINLAHVLAQQLSLTMHSFILVTPGPERRHSRSATTPGSKTAGTPGSKSAGTPGVERRSDRLRQRLVDIVKGSVGGIGMFYFLPAPRNIMRCACS